MSKVWVLVDGGPTDTICFGPDQELLWLSPEYEVDGATLMVASAPALVAGRHRSRRRGASGAGLSPERPGARQRRARLERRPAGAWRLPAHRPGTLSRDASALQDPEGRICFAGADIATRWIGWLNGALESGARAAQQALAVLAAPGGPPDA